MIMIIVIIGIIRTDRIWAPGRARGRRGPPTGRRRRRGGHPRRRAAFVLVRCYSYEEFTRLAETRLARNSCNYISIAQPTLKQLSNVGKSSTPCRDAGPARLPPAGPRASGDVSYEEFTRLAETRLAQNTLNALTYIKLP